MTRLAASRIRMGSPLRERRAGIPAPVRRRRLAQAEIAEANLVEHLEPPKYFRRAAEKGERLAHRQIEHLVNRAAAIADLEHLRLEPLAVALIAGNEHVGEELHLDAHLA